jgi:hypothetical protein
MARAPWRKEIRPCRSANDRAQFVQRSASWPDLIIVCQRRISCIVPLYFFIVLLQKNYHDHRDRKDFLFAPLRRGSLRYELLLSPLAAFVHALIDCRNLFNPTPSVGVLEIQNRLRRPVKMISHKGYLLVQRFEGVAYNPPAPFNST